MQEEMVRCMQWTMEDCLDWVSRNWKEDKDHFGEIEAAEPPPTVFIHATKHIPVTNPETGVVAMFDYFRDAKTAGISSHIRTLS
jgi:hypothetical protein